MSETQPTQSDSRSDQYIVVDAQQAAQFFRSFDQRSCQFEGGRMRWWLEANLRLELVPDGPGFGEWRLYVVPTRSHCDDDEKICAGEFAGPNACDCGDPARHV